MDGGRRRVHRACRGDSKESTRNNESGGDKVASSDSRRDRRRIGGEKTTAEGEDSIRAVEASPGFKSPFGVRWAEDTRGRQRRPRKRRTGASHAAAGLGSVWGVECRAIRELEAARARGAESTTGRASVMGGRGGRVLALVRRKKKKVAESSWLLACGFTGVDSEGGGSEQAATKPAWKRDRENEMGRLGWAL